ncbi:hypothetical protein [Nocardia wallacei]|uniref:Uncharacterized protein n=1 Tax=Nocardia wallacei TaxID=480035 RepID=A0A7G1KBM0_9NOCA|nr:hypothetical protein [Nocardia wallacei]BCK52568.1 hypothetical protein NWFMUON74_03400 [Nocardia wallacei]
MKWLRKMLASDNSGNTFGTPETKEETSAAALGKATAEVSFHCRLSVPAHVITSVGSSGATLAILEIAQRF